ncbi:MAG: hypothetical protein ACK5OX_15395 [Desertimonas sp.]
MNATDEQIRSFLARLDDASPMAPPLDELLANRPRIDPATSRRSLATAAAAVVVALGFGGLSVLTSRASAPAERARATTPRPPDFPRLAVGPATAEALDLRLVGGQDCPVSGGWFTFLNYDAGDDAFLHVSVTVFSGSSDDLEFATCDVAGATDHRGRDVHIVALDRYAEVLRLAWLIGPDEVALLETFGLTVDRALEVLDGLTRPSPSEWNALLTEVPPDEFVSTSESTDAIWNTYTRDGTAAVERNAPPMSTPANGRSGFCLDAHAVAPT